MGCNTSKEAGGVDEKSKNKAATTENETRNDDDVRIAQDSKPESAKTITLTSNGSLIRDNLEQAASKIQAAFRGHQTRKSMKHSGKGKAGSQGNTQKVEENDTDLSEAATKIQASFRGHLARKQMEKKDNKTPESHHDKKDDNDEELDIDLSDPELNKAAVKIQASFRGHMVRKEENEPDTKDDK